MALIEAAVSDKAGDAGFEDNTGSGTGHLSVDGNLKVVTIVLDEFVDGKSHPDPDFLKMDIKGGEIGGPRWGPQNHRMSMPLFIGRYPWRQRTCFRFGLPRTIRLRS